MQPPPSASTGNNHSCLLAGLLSTVGGVVVMRKSPLSLTRVRRPTTESPEEVVVMRSTPRNELPSEGNMSPRNLAACPDSRRFSVTGETPAGAPPSVFKSNVTVAGEDDVFATAMPLWMLPSPDDSTYMRNAVPLVTGTPASETVTIAGLDENNTRGVGAGPSPFGTTRSDPEVLVNVAPAVLSFCELRPATVYAKVLSVCPQSSRLLRRHQGL